MQSDKPQTTQQEARDPFKHMKSAEVMKTLPCSDDLNLREYSIHRRGYEAGMAYAERRLKEEILHKLQIILWGHVL